MRRSLVLNITGLAGTGKTSTINRLASTTPRVCVSSPGETIRHVAAAQGIMLTSRAEYNCLHDEIIRDDPEAITSPILEQAKTYPLVLIDGLRVYSHARWLRKELGDRYRTAVLTCPDEIRAKRILEDNSRTQRDSSHFADIQAVLKDEQSVVDSWYQFPKVLAMHDLTPEPIDTFRYSPDDIAAQIALAIRPYICST
jgi:cytidylate kinase